MSQIIVVKDATNSKLRELESNASGELKVVSSSLPLPSGASTESTLASVLADTNIIAEAMTACDTGDVTISSSALPTGAATEVSAAAAASSAGAINGKITACNTGAVVVSGSALPTGAATEVSAGACATSLSTLAGAVSLGVVQVSSGAISSSATTVYSAVGIANLATTKSASKDINAYRSVCIFGDSSVNSGSVEIEVSADNSNWYELNNAYMAVDMSSGNFGGNFDISARYVRLSRSNSSGSIDTITAIISAK